MPFSVARRLSWLAPRARRWTQVTLGVLWLIDGALQLQPYMLGTGLARGVIEPVGQGQPALVAESVNWAAHLILAWPAGFDVMFALVQLGIGAAILYRPTLRLGLAASVAWAAAVWWLGEGAGQVIGGAATLITGAPGSVLLYAIIALLVWPRACTSRWTSSVWTALWAAGALLQLLPAQRGADSVGAAITSGAAMSPSWLAPADLTLGRAASGAAASASAIVTALFLVIAVAPYLVRPARTAGLALGALTASAIWVVGEGLGGFSTGQATDPNTGPLLILLAFATVIATSEPRAWDAERPAAADSEVLPPARATRRRAAWALTVVAAASAVAIAASGQQPRPVEQATAGMRPMERTSSHQASRAMPTMTDPLTVRVRGTGSASIYLDLDDNGQRSYTQRTVTLPYSLTVNGQEESIAVMAELRDNATAATISCAIDMDGTSMAADRASGVDPLVSCEADP
jgi:hypothetical protein